MVAAWDMFQAVVLQIEASDKQGWAWDVYQWRAVEVGGRGTRRCRTSNKRTKRLRTARLPCIDMTYVHFIHVRSTLGAGWENAMQRATTHVESLSKGFVVLHLGRYLGDETPRLEHLEQQIYLLLSETYCAIRILW